MIKTGDTEKAADNLKFLVDAGLVSDADRRKNIRNFLADRPAGTGPALPVTTRNLDIGWTWDIAALVVRLTELGERLNADNPTAQEREKLTDESSALKQRIEEILLKRRVK